MPAPRPSLKQIVATLEDHYGPPKSPPLTDPFQIILFENVAYLVDDAQRRRTWLAFKKHIGVKPRQILDADATKIANVIRDGGMNPQRRAEKLIECAEIVTTKLDGDLKPLFIQPLPKIRRGLKLFPSIGDPGADKILLLARIQPLLSLDSNALRVLLRLGHGTETKNYSATYRSVQNAIADQLPTDFDWLIKAHQLLRHHGQQLCKRTMPDCDLCPLRKTCAFAKRVKVT